MASLRWFSLNGEGNILNFNGNYNVVGDINFVGNLYRNGVLFGDGSGGPELWDGTFAGGIHYLGPVVGIGTSTPNTAYKLEVQGDININGDIYKNGVIFEGGGGGSLWSDAGGKLSTNVNVGIGTTDPEASLHVFGTETAYNAAKGIRVGTGVDYATINYITDPALTEHLMIQSRKSGVDFERNIVLNPLGGRIGVGTSEPAYKLDVFGDINFTGELLKNGVVIGSSAGDAWKADGPNIYFDEGNIGIGTFPSTYRLTVNGDTNLSITSVYRINENEVLSETALGTSVVSSSLTSVGNLTDLTVNTNNLVATGSSVGIGLTEPLYTLDVNGDINITGDLYKEGTLIPLSQWSNFGGSIFYDGGSVGIGLTNPTVPLDVFGNARIVGNSTLTGNVSVGGEFSVNTNLLSAKAGQVGIGTTVTTETLTVNGSTSISRPIGDVFTSITIGGFDITSVGYNPQNETYFASSVSGQFFTSNDAITWTSSAIAVGFIPIRVIYSNTYSLYFAVGSSPGSNPKVYTSADGTTWSPYVSITSDLRDIVISDVNLIVVCGSNTVVYSEDGTTWITVSLTGIWNSITWSQVLNLFVVVGEDGDIQTSNDSITWEIRTSGVTSNLLSVESSETLIVAVGVLGVIVTSLDGVSWTVDTIGDTDDLFTVVKNPLLNNFLIGTTNGLVYSYPPYEPYQSISNVTDVYVVFINENPETLLIAGADGNGSLSVKQMLLKVENDGVIVNGNLTVDTDVLVVNSTDNRVGINTDTPGYALDVVGDARVTGNFTFGNATMYYKADTTRLGINIEEPTVELDILGQAKITNIATGYALEVDGDINFTGGLFENGVPFVSGGGGGGGDPADALPVGAFVSYPWSAPIPDGFLKCDGQEVSRSVYSQLFAILGEEYGSGDGSTTFNLPTFFDNIVKFRALGGTTTVDYLPIGSVITLSWVIDPYPDGWLKCVGTEVSRTLYSQLFEAVGTDYGSGDGSTTFNLPTFFNQGIKYRTTIEGGLADNAYWISAPDSSLYNMTNVGIGTTDPQFTLDVGGDINVSGGLFSNGQDVSGALYWSETEGQNIVTGVNVGIGVTGEPSDKLHVAGSLNLSSGSALKINGTEVLTGSGLGTGVTGSSLTSVGTLSSLLVSGNVGIGTTNPAERLHVSGNLRVGDAVLAQPSGSAPLYTARAWVNFNGELVGTNPLTITPNGSGNVSSVTRTGSGDYTVNFTTVMPNTNYSVVANSGTGSTGRANQSISIGTKTQSSVRIFNSDTFTNAIINSADINVIVMA